MKLRLPLKLLSALLSFYAISDFHVFAATEWDGSRYSGNIYTWVGSSSNDFHNGGIVLTNPDGTYTERGNDILRQTPFGRMGQAEELCGTIHYLMSEASRFVTGTVAIVDGGFNAFTL